MHNSFKRYEAHCEIDSVICTTDMPTQCRLRTKLDINSYGDGNKRVRYILCHTLLNFGHQLLSGYRPPGNTLW